MIALHIILGWLAMAVLGIANGILREKLLQRVLGRYALPASGIILSTMIGTLIVIMNPAAGMNAPAGFSIGITWVIMTIIFECIFGRKQGKTWHEIGRAYTLQDGNLWSLVLIVIALAPVIAVAIP